MAPPGAAKEAGGGKRPASAAMRGRRRRLSAPAQMHGAEGGGRDTPPAGVTAAPRAFRRGEPQGERESGWSYAATVCEGGHRKFDETRAGTGPRRRASCQSAVLAAVVLCHMAHITCAGGPATGGPGGFEALAAEVHAAGSARPSWEHARLLTLCKSWGGDILRAHRTMCDIGGIGHSSHRAGLRHAGQGARDRDELDGRGRRLGWGWERTRGGTDALQRKLERKHLDMLRFSLAYTRGGGSPMLSDIHQSLASVFTGGGRRQGEWGEEEKAGTDVVGAWSSRRAGQCADCGKRCVPTKVAKPMRGECVGPTSAEFYVGNEVQPGRGLWRVQFLPMRVCVGTNGEANRRAGFSESGLVRIDERTLNLEVGDVQDECRQFWKDLPDPPTFYHTCNDPLRTEEAQMTGYSVAEFQQTHTGTFKSSVAAAMNNLKLNSSSLVLAAENVQIESVEAGSPCAALTTTDVDGNVTEYTLEDDPCECQVLNSYKMDCPAVCCRNLLNDDRAGIRIRFRIVGIDAEFEEDVDQLLFGGDVLGLEIEKEMGKITGDFNQVKLSPGRDGTPCGGPDDLNTCLLGDICRPITARKSFTEFISRDWWVRTDRRWYGGTVPAKMMLREWYCDNDPRLMVGKVRLGQLGWTDFYLRNSNLHVKSECDHTSGAAGLKTGLGSLGALVEEEEIKMDPDRHCATINATSPVPADCCGYCFLSNIHLAKLFNCTGMQDILNNDEAIHVLAEYCIKTRLCREQRPCTGEPVEMGATYHVYCDPLNRGCDTPYVDGRPLLPGEKKCGYKWACDHRIHSIRLRIGYFTNDTSIFEPPEVVDYYVMGAGVVVLIIFLIGCLGGCAFMIYRRHKFIADKKARKLEKEKRKFLRKREARTANDPVYDAGDGDQGEESY